MACSPHFATNPPRIQYKANRLKNTQRRASGNVGRASQAPRRRVTQLATCSRTIPRATNLTQTSANRHASSDIAVARTTIGRCKNALRSTGTNERTAIETATRSADVSVRAELGATQRKVTTGATRREAVALMREAVDVTRAAGFIRHAHENGEIDEAEATEARAIAEAILREAELAQAELDVLSAIEPSTPELDELDDALVAIEDVLLQVPSAATWADPAEARYSDLLDSRDELLQRIASGIATGGEVAAHTAQVDMLAESMQADWERHKAEAHLPERNEATFDRSASMSSSMHGQ